MRDSRSSRNSAGQPSASSSALDRSAWLLVVKSSLVCVVASSALSSGVVATAESGCDMLDSEAVGEEALAGLDVRVCW